MQIVFINNDGAGFADRLEIAEGTTIQTLFTEKLPYGDPAAYLIRVNRLPTTEDYVLQAEDRLWNHSPERSLMCPGISFATASLHQQQCRVSRPGCCGIF